MMKNDLDGFLPAQQVANTLGKHVSTIYRWSDSGAIEEIRIGKRRYIKTKSIVAYLGKDVAALFGLE